MSSPAWAWAERASPKEAATVPETGVAIRPEPQPPPVAGAGADTVLGAVAGACFGAAGAETAGVFEAGVEPASRDVPSREVRSPDGAASPCGAASPDGAAGAW